MTPNSVLVEIDDRDLREGLARLLERGTNLAPALGEMGEYLALAHDDRFERRVTPDGARWATVSQRHAQRKAAGKAGEKSRRGRTRDPSDILELTGQLRDTLAGQRIVLTSTVAEPGNLKMSTEDSILMLSGDLRFVPSAAGNEYSIAYT